MPNKPKIRPIEAVPAVVEGKQVIVIRDPAEIARPAVVGGQVLFLMSLMDGTREYLEIQENYYRQFGDLLMSSDLDRVLKELDENLLLESKKFQERLEELKAAYRREPVRQPACAGSTYPEDPDELRAFLENMFETPKAQERPDSDKHRGRIRGLIAPHIDFQRGGSVYANVYGTLDGNCDAEVFVILGVSHKGGDSHFSLTRKDYLTPLGIARTDVEFVDKLASKLDGDPFRDEFYHRSEHSVELQIPILQHLFGGLDGGRIVPILCGSLQPAIKAGKTPSEVPEIRNFIDALRQTLDECGKPWLVIAGVDLAHVGRFFGGEGPLSPSYLADLEKADRDMLAKVEELDAEGFYQVISAEADARNVCGALPIYTIAELLRPGRANLIDYRQCVVPEAENCVTIAGMLIH